MIRCLFIALWLALGVSGTAAAQAPGSTSQQPDPDLWAISDTRIASVPARIAFPRDAAGLSAVRTQEFSHEGEGIDNGIQYRSADDAIWATVYIYYPGLPHAGLMAVATDNAIRVNSESPVQGGAFNVVGAGGVDAVAIRALYTNYLGSRSSSAAFIKAGRWIVKIRVTGPGDRESEIIAAMDALLDGIEFGRANPPRAAAPLEVSDCPSGTGTRDAREMPDPPGGELAAHALLATFDGGGIEGTDEQGAPAILPSRLPSRFCRTTVTLGEVSVPVLRADPGEAESVDGRTMLVVVVSDSGEMLEVVHARNLGGYTLLWHQVGMTTLLGRFDAMPSDSQIAAIFRNPQSGAGRSRVPVRIRPGEGPTMWLPPADPET